jgi:hypothetical protein
VWWEGDERGYMKFHGDGRGVGRYAKNSNILDGKIFICI